MLPFSLVASCDMTHKDDEDRPKKTRALSVLDKENALQYCHILQESMLQNKSVLTRAEIKTHPVCLSANTAQKSYIYILVGSGEINYFK